MATNAMLAVPTKRPANFLDIKGPISKYIQSSFSAGAADQAANKLNQAQILRNKATEMAGGAEELKDAFISYYRFLTALENALPIGKERGGVALRFQWADAFQPDRGDGRSDVAFEKASLLFNLGAVASQVAMGADLSSESGVKNAARSYQEAAGVFGYLSERLVPRLETPYPVDLSPECTAMLATLCLAQAQECFYTKAAADKKSPALLARIARQVAIYYSGIAGMQLSEQLKRELGKPMAAHLSIKAALYASLTLLHQAEVFIADDECGQQLACLQEAQRLLHAARREGTGWVKVDKELIARVDDSLEAADKGIKKAERENSSLYFQRVPPAADVSPPAPAALVSPLPPPEDLEAADERWFGFLEDAGAIAQDDRNRNARSAYMGQADSMPDAPASLPQQQQPGSRKDGSGGVGSTLGKFAFGAAKGVAGWAFNQAAEAVSQQSGQGGRSGKGAASRNVAAMYDSPREVTIGDLFSSTPAQSSRSRDEERRADSRQYVEKVRELINSSIDAIATADKTRDKTLQRWNLPEALGGLEQSAAAGKLPRDAQKAVERHRRDGGVQHLVQLLDEIQAAKEGAVRHLDTIEAQLNAEAKEDEGARQHYGDAWPLQDASVVAANLRDSIAGYRENLREADNSDRKLQKLVADNEAAFAALGLGTLPGSSERGRRGSGSDVTRVIAEIRSDLGEVDRLAEERRRLHDAFKQQWNEDGIIQAQGRDAPVWQLDQGYNKFEDLSAALQRNTVAQDAALERLEWDMKQHGDALSKAAREQPQDAARVASKFGNVEQSLKGGLQFYTDLQGYIAALERDANAYLQQRYEEGRDAVSLMERTRSHQKWGQDSGSKASSGGGWPFGSGGGGGSKKNRWFAAPEQHRSGCSGRVISPQQPCRRQQLGRSLRRQPRCSVWLPAAGVRLGAVRAL